MFTAPHPRLWAAALLLLALAACEVGGYGEHEADDAGACPSCAGAGGSSGASTSAGSGVGGASSGGAGNLPDAGPGDFALRPEYAGPCVQASGAIDVNLGNSAENFVRAAFCQVNGAEPSEAVVSMWASQLRTVEYVRRIDVVRTFCRDAARATCPLAYSNPWVADLPLTAGCQRKTTRDLGAVMMFFNECPAMTNCGMDWANTHAHGMNQAHPLLGFGSVAVDYYNPRNAGFWYRELMDARWAGLQFLLLNVYGPELARMPDPLERLSQALAMAGTDVKIGLFDDPWAWGRPSSPLAFQTRPNLSDTEGAAQTLYQAKWKPFYTRIPKQFWYNFQNRPFIYFYNAGTLTPANVSAAVVARMKQLFVQDFGVEPFVAVDTAYFQDPTMNNVADSRFTWETLRSGMKSRYTTRGVTLDHFMVKWDTVGRDKAGVIATSADRVLKNTSLLGDRLAGSLDAQVAVIATWNDMGEGTGVARNYDYFIGGLWQPPTAFMGLTRASQCSD